MVVTFKETYEGRPHGNGTIIVFTKGKTYIVPTTFGESVIEQGIAESKDIPESKTATKTKNLKRRNKEDGKD